MQSILDEVELLRRENESLRDDVGALRGDVAALRGDFQALRKNGEEGRSSAVVQDATAAEAEGNAAKKKKKRKKKKGKNDKVANIDGGGAKAGSLKNIASGASTGKIAIAVGLLSVALFASIALGQGIVENPPLIWGQRSVQSNEQSGGDPPARISSPAGRVSEGIADENSPSLRTQDSGKPRSAENLRQTVPSVMTRNVREFIFPANTRANGGEGERPRTLQETLPPDVAENKAEATSSPSASTTAMETYLPTATPGTDTSDESTDLPTSQFYPGYACDADPTTCGCPDLLGSDYRGTIRETKDGTPCENWGADDRRDDPDAGLEENFCRNPNGVDPNGPWCYVAGGEWDYCDVPACDALTAPPTASAIPTSSGRPSVSPSSSSPPSSSSSPTQLCPVADRDLCGCENVQQSDYRGALSTTREGFDCLRWDTEWLMPYLTFDYLQTFPRAGLEDNFCRNPDNDSDGPYCLSAFPDGAGYFSRYCDVPKCDPCSCSPRCGEPNNEACACPSVLQANRCCEAEDVSCRCPYLKDACRKSLENNVTDFCEDAEDACCEGKGEGAKDRCKCNMYEQFCSDHPSQSTCGKAASRCCEPELDWYDDNARCYCVFFTYVGNVLNLESKSRSEYCSDATPGITNPSYEKQVLAWFFDTTGGKYWIDNTDWLNDSVPHCRWFGIKCNDRRGISEINLRDNNLTGNAEVLYDLELSRLTKLDLAGNKLSGRLGSADILNRLHLVYLDVSGNCLTGHADMSFPQTTSYVNFSHNNFTSLGFKRFNPAYETLRVVDLSDNDINQYVSEMFLNIPPNLEKLILSNNDLKGALPNPFPLENLRDFAIENNAINGYLPDLPALLRTLDLSNQTQGESGGLSGTIPATLSTLAELSHLNLAGNKFARTIPTALGNLESIQVLNLSSNALDGSIPTELGKLIDVLEVLDLSANMIAGSIPIELVDKEGALAHFLLRGNANISDPAPLDLCALNSGFDLLNDTRLCPPERNALREFYVSAKGNEWTESRFWLDPIATHCEWEGIKCNMRNNVDSLKLPNNGLSGKLSEAIAALTSLEHLDLSDNDIKGSIPTEIANLVNLKYLRLCYNQFVGNETALENLNRLELIQLQGNRLSGTLPRLDIPFVDPSSFVSDCGNPSDLENSLVCEDCSMCCNSQGACHHTGNDVVQKTGFKNYTRFSFVFIACLLGACVVLGLAVYAHDKYQNRGLATSSIRQPDIIERDEKYALSTIGEDSVYQFFIGKSWSGWIIVLLCIAAQMWLLTFFVGGAEIDWRTDSSDLVYTWECARDQDKCMDKSDNNWRGWLAFTILTGAHLLKDIINGTKLIVLSGKKRNGPNARARYFVGGVLLSTISIFTLYVSIIYNSAIATSNREIIENSVIILFLLDIDEMLFDILMAINQDWVAGMLHQEGKNEQSVVAKGREGKNDEEDGLEADPRFDTEQNVEVHDKYGAIEILEGKVQGLESEVGALRDTVKQQNVQLERLLAKAQDECRDFEF